VAEELKSKVLAKRGMSKPGAEPITEEAPEAEETPAPKAKRGAKVTEEA
jgi:hypothetical protein